MSENKDLSPTLSVVLDQETESKYYYLRNRSIFNIVYVGFSCFWVYILFINNSSVLLTLAQILTAGLLIRQFYLVKALIHCRNLLKTQEKLLKIQELIKNDKITPEIMEMSLKDICN